MKCIAKEKRWEKSARCASQVEFICCPKVEGGQRATW
jgi:hypothetical protein